MCALVRAFSAMARASAAIVAVIGVAVLVGWAADVAWLRDPLGGFVPMVPNTALMLMCSGLALALRASPSASRRRRWTARALAASGVAIALATIAEHVLHTSLGIDALLFNAHPARPCLPTAIALALANIALLVLDVRPRRGPTPAEILAAAVAAIGALAMSGYLYWALQFYASGAEQHTVGMAVHTSAALLVLALGIFAARAESGAMAIVTSPLVGGQAVRRMLLVAVAVLVVGYFSARGARVGLYIAPRASVVEAVAGLFVAILITLAVGRSLNRSDLERRRMEAELLSARARELAQRKWLEAVIERTPEAMIIVDETKTITQNTASAALAGAGGVPDPNGKPIPHDVRTPSGERISSDRLPLYHALLDGETTLASELAIVAPSGELVPVLASAAPVVIEGRRRGAIVVFRDIRAQKKLEREREEWSSVVAHDLRQPTAAIRMAAEVLSRTGGAPVSRTVETIRRASERLERMIGDLLDVSRIEARRLEVRTERLDVPALVAEVLELTPALSTRCRTDIDGDARCAWADAGRFVQVLANLLSNADKYSKPGTPIDVRVDLCGEMVRVSVTNEGPGIAPDEIPQLFSRFARTRTARGGSVPGLGLGLYICRGVVEALGGKLWVESVPGEKTHFRFTLPWAAPIEEERRDAPRHFVAPSMQS
jgi:PAS domain S-box-containing protein